MTDLVNLRAYCLTGSRRFNTAAAVASEIRRLPQMAALDASVYMRDHGAMHTARVCVGTDNKVIGKIMFGWISDDDNYNTLAIAISPPDDDRLIKALDELAKINGWKEVKGNPSNVQGEPVPEETPS